MRFIAALSIPALLWAHTAVASPHVEGSFTATITSGFHSIGCCGVNVTDLTGTKLEVQFGISPSYNSFTNTTDNRGFATNQIGPGYWAWNGDWTASKNGLTASFSGWEGNDGSSDYWEITWDKLTKSGRGSYTFNNAYAFEDELYEYSISNMRYVFAVPEPETWAMLLLGCFVMGAWLRRPGLVRKVEML